MAIGARAKFVLQLDVLIMRAKEDLQVFCLVDKFYGLNLRYVGKVYRMSSEADAYVLQATIGCSWNKELTVRSLCFYQFDASDQL